MKISLGEILKNPTVIAALIAAVTSFLTSFSTTEYRIKNIREETIELIRLEDFQESRKKYHNDYDLFMSQYNKDQFKIHNKNFFDLISKFYIASLVFYERNRKLFDSELINKTISEVNLAIENHISLHEDGLTDVQDPHVKKIYKKSLDLRLKAIKEIYDWSNKH